MWYIIVIFCIAFQIIISMVAPHMINIAFTGIDTATAVNATASETLLAGGLNPFEFFVGSMTFSINGLEFFGALFWFLDILLIICVIKLIRGS